MTKEYFLKLLGTYGIPVSHFDDEKVRHVQDKIFEIKSNEIRSLFKYASGKIIIVGVVFVKKTQKTPKDKIKLAKQRLKDV